MIIASGTHVATDWTALGIFFLGFIGTMGGFAAWIINRLEKNRADWKIFVSAEIANATNEIKKDIQDIREQMFKNSQAIDNQGERIIKQGENIAHLTGKLEK